MGKATNTVYLVVVFPDTLERGQINVGDLIGWPRGVQWHLTNFKDYWSIYPHQPALMARACHRDVSWFLLQTCGQ